MRRAQAVRMLSVLVGSAVTTVALAQTEPPPIEPVPVAPAIPAARTPLRDGYGWTQVAPLRLGPAADVDVSTENTDIVAAVGMDGGVWLTEDAGASWRRILDASQSDLSDDEDRLQQLDAYLQEVVDEVENELGVSFDDIDPDADTFDGDLAEAALDFTQDLSDEAQTDLATQSFLFGEEGVPGVLRPHLHFTHGHDELWVGRDDGLWYSNDLGENWEHVLYEPTTEVAIHPQSGLYVAGTSDGFRYAVQPDTWIDAEDGTEGMLVLDIDPAPDGLYAGTIDGLWYADTPQHWIPTGPTSDPIAAVQPDPSATTSLWIALEEGIVRSDDRGVNFRATPGAQLAEVRDLLLLPGNRLMATSNDGPWESRDGGTTWQPIPRGLSSPVVGGLSGTSASALYLASEDGIYKLVPLDQMEESRSGVVTLPEWLSAGDLLTASLTRPGIDTPKNQSRLRRLNAFLPQVRFRFDARTDRDLRYTAASGTTRSADADIRAFAFLTWAPNGRTGEIDVSGVVMDGELFILGGDDESVLAARAGRRGAAYRTKVSEQVIDLYGARIELLIDKASLPSASLEDQVEFRLRELEVEAQLDVLTDGLISRYNAQQSLGDSP